MYTSNKRLARTSALRRMLMTVALGVAVTGTGWPAAWASCSEKAEALRGAIAAQDLDEVSRRYEALFKEPKCNDAVRYRTGIASSAVFAQVAQERMEAGASLESQRPILERGLSFARIWPLLAMLGDAAHEASDYDAASDLYQEALVAIDDEEMTPTAPPEPVIERIFRLATQSRMLSEAYTPVPKGPSGAPGGLAAMSIRSFNVKRVQVPITFPVDSAEFTPNGHRAAADLAEYLIYQAPERITLVGHTDHTGPDTHNLDLSRRRAEAVARYLYSQGFQGRIEVVAMGESDPFPLNDPDAYTYAQRLQMDRRVELIR